MPSANTTMPMRASTSPRRDSVGGSAFATTGACAVLLVLPFAFFAIAETRLREHKRERERERERGWGGDAFPALSRSTCARLSGWYPACTQTDSAWVREGVASTIDALHMSRVRDENGYVSCAVVVGEIGNEVQVTCGRDARQRCSGRSLEWEKTRDAHGCRRQYNGINEGKKKIVRISYTRYMVCCTDAPLCPVRVMEVAFGERERDAPVRTEPMRNAVGDDA